MLITKQIVVDDIDDVDVTVDVTVDVVDVVVNVGFGVGVGMEDVGVGLVAPDQSAILYSLRPGGGSVLTK